MAENKVLDAATAVVAALESLDSDERARAVQAALNILGETGVPLAAVAENTMGGSASGATTAKEFFDQKSPDTKIQNLAVAARFREDTENAEDSTKQNLRKVITDARRNFDNSNYPRDISNARDRGLFNKGTGSKVVLSHRGQNFVDALPDQKAAKKILGKKRKKKKLGKKKAKKKTG